MNQKLLICLAASANDGPLAERLLDFIYKIHGKKQVGHLLIVANSDLHSEMRRKIAVTAELAFESVTETVAPAIDAKFANSKFHQLNNLFRHAAKTAQDQCRWPWFWMEPDCVPVKSDWIEQLAEAYDSQPKKYMGLIAKAEKSFMARCGIYYGAASYELGPLCMGDIPFPLATAEKVVPCAARTNLVQYLTLETPEDLAKISEKAVVLHGDKMGIFAENWKAPITITVSREFWESSGGNATEFVPPIQTQVRAAANSSGAMALTPIPSTFAEATVTKENIEGLGEATMIQTNPAPRITRRQKAEALDKARKLDCVATNGCKSSTPVQSV